MNEEGFHTYCGGFWNYFSMGMDAQASYAFHTERKLHPEKFKNQLVNQAAYAKLSCKQGWFCASLTHPSSRRHRTDDEENRTVENRIGAAVTELENRIVENRIGAAVTEFFFPLS